MHIPEPILYKCKDCGWVGPQNDMGSDELYTEWEDVDGGYESDVMWSNWVCPECKRWWESLEEGYTEMANPASK